MEIDFPVEFIVYGTAVSLQASTKSKNIWKTEVKTASYDSLPEGHFWYEGRAALTLYYFPSEAMIGDVDNIIKTVQDALSKHILKDDHQIDRVVVQRFDPDATFEFTDPSATLEKALFSPESALYVKISNDPYEDLL
jgi:crossover junction endodeoxyribonuclease RusA